ncbi:hypothetical protein [Lacihabitans lacunae]|uniref:Uncharacterized protein n=1 Tax=Lacihabitans lacunae TaxID=1028214 RepID=A0ABV7Z2A6_9BACT
MELREIKLSAQYNRIFTKEFNSETWSLSELYWSFIKEYNTGKVKKCNVVVSDDWGDLLEYYESYVDMITIRNHFAFDTYSTLGKEDRKRMQLEAVHKGMMQIAEKEGWEIDPLLDAYNKCLEKNLAYQFEVGKPKSSPDKKHKIGFWCNWDIDIFEVYWILFDKSGKELKREKFIEKKAFEGEFIYYSKFKWKDSQTVIFEDKYKYGTNEVWEFNPFK